MKLIVLGSTGLVGRRLLEFALTDERVGSVIAPVRRAIGERAKLVAPLVEFEDLPDAEWWGADALACALGTTMRAAGSRAAFRRVDHDYPMLAARLAHKHGTPAFVLNSAIGADARSRFFYNRVKGELERDLQAIGFRSLTFVRPGLIGGKREQARPVEHVLQIMSAVLDPVLPQRFRINPAEYVARAMLDAALASHAGVHVVTSDAMVA